MRRPTDEPSREDREAVPPSSGAVAAESPPAPPPAACSTDCLLFEDHFDRLLGGWTRHEGQVGLGSDGPRASILAVELPAANDVSFRRALVVRDVGAGMRGVRIEATMRATLDGYVDDAYVSYCEVLTVSLGSDRLASIYVGYNNDWGTWLWNQDQVAGAGAWSQKAAANWTELAIDVTWTAEDATMLALIDGAPFAPKEIALGKRDADGVVSVSAGARCTGNTPKISAFADSVVVRSSP